MVRGGVDRGIIVEVERGDDNVVVISGRGYVSEHPSMIMVSLRGMKGSNILISWQELGILGEQ